jgi:hypothetical protein
LPRAAPFVSTTEDQLRTAIDTEYGLVPPRRGVLGFAARLSANTRVHDTATLRAVAHGRVRASMIHVLAWVAYAELSHQAPLSFPKRRTLPRPRSIVSRTMWIIRV